MRFLKRLLIGLVLLVAAFATAVWMQPDDYRLTRQIAIADRRQAKDTPPVLPR